MHVAVCSPAGSRCRLSGRIIPLTLPWMMAQHFSVRLHGQFVFRRLVNLCECRAAACHQLYRPHLDALDKVVNYGAGAKNAAKLDDDFYMANCVLSECETFDLIFDKIPRAYGLTDLEAVPRRLFQVGPDCSWARQTDREVKTNVCHEVRALQRLEDSAGKPTKGENGRARIQFAAGSHR